MRAPGHTVLAVPVPALESYVRERTAFYDPSFLSRDPGFVHAHVTVLAPWLAAPGEEDLARVGRIAATTPAFTTALARVEEFPDGVIHLRLDPDDRLRELTSRLAAAFPTCPPYGGAFAEVVPHLTLDRHSAEVSVASVRAQLTLPIRIEIDRLDLQWWDNHDCRLLRSWPLGADAGVPGRP